MSSSRANPVLRHIRGLSVRASNLADDRQLLERFNAHGDETAFEALVRRHGPMVLGVCRRALHNTHDAEDAFQATFLVLARKAGSVRKQESLGGWLYRVAYHVSLKARERASARQRREVRAARQERTDSLAEITGRELLSVMDEQLQQLTERERTALILCYLEGKTCHQAAREACCSVSTLKRRLERGKERMRARLARRGITLPAALLAAGLTTKATAMVPCSLTMETVSAALLVTSGHPLGDAASSTVAALAQEAMNAMKARATKAIVASLLSVALLGVSQVLGPTVTPHALLLSPQQALAEQAKPAPSDRDDKNRMTVTGRVLDGDGRPLPGADIAILALTEGGYRGGDLSSGNPTVIISGRADARGDFHLNMPRHSSVGLLGLAIASRVAGHALSWQALDIGANKQAVELRLAPEQVIRGRLVDDQGQPAVGVAVRVHSIRLGERGSNDIRAPINEEPPCWPKSAITDKEGRFEIGGIGSESMAALRIRDDRFALQDLGLPATGKEVTKTLKHAYFIEGTVTYADTKNPVPNARLTVYAGASEHGGWTGLDGRADEKGSFRLIPTPGNYFQVTAYAPDGEPYLTIQQVLKWPEGATTQRVDFKLPHGLLVHGQITEAGSGKPVPKAIVKFIPRQSNDPNFRSDAVTGSANAVLSGEDGRFRICVQPVSGHLLIHGPTNDYVFSEVDGRMLDQGKAGGNRYYAHAIVPMNLGPGVETYAADVTLRQGVTIKGRLVGASGEPVAEALMLSRLNVDRRESYWRGFPDMARGGRFELHGCDPEKSYEVSFLDAIHKAGATIELQGKQANKEVTVGLLPCGQSTTRLIDERGKPIANVVLGLELVVAPGASRYDLTKLYGKGQLAADSAYVANIDPVNYRSGPLTDAMGRIIFPALIPGATYRIVEVGDRSDMVKCEFKAESGKTITLPDVVRKKGP